MAGEEEKKEATNQLSEVKAILQRAASSRSEENTLEG